MVEIFRDSDNQWRWRVVADNNRVVATCGEGYHNRKDCIHGLHVVTRHIIESALNAWMWGTSDFDSPEPPAPEQD